jgi:hypothetical protein
MRRSGTFIVAASVALGSGLAQAADLEVVKAEPTIYVQNSFLWGGVYVGGFVGGGWGTADWGPGLVTVSFTNPVGTALLFIPHANVPVSGFLGGGRVGVNYQAGPSCSDLRAISPECCSRAIPPLRSARLVQPQK